MAVTSKGSVPFFLPHAACWEAGAPAVGAQADHRPLRAHVGSSSPLVRAALLGNIIIVSPRSSLCHWLLCWAGISRVAPFPTAESSKLSCVSISNLSCTLSMPSPAGLPAHSTAHSLSMPSPAGLAARPHLCPALLALLPTALLTPYYDWPTGLSAHNTTHPIHARPCPHHCPPLFIPSPAGLAAHSLPMPGPAGLPTHSSSHPCPCPILLASLPAVWEAMGLLAQCSS